MSQYGHALLAFQYIGGKFRPSDDLIQQSRTLNRREPDTIFRTRTEYHHYCFYFSHNLYPQQKLTNTPYPV